MYWIIYLFEKKVFPHLVFLLSQREKQKKKNIQKIIIKTMEAVVSTNSESTPGVIIEEKEGPESEMISQLKEKFHCTDRLSEKIQILTILPRS